MTLPLVSCVCLTTHPRRAAFLGDALVSYRAQTYPARELLVVNDGEPLRSRAEDVRVVNLPDRGARWTVGEKRNVGVRLARGEYLATWDDDDVSLPERLAEQVARAEQWGAAAVLADRMAVADARLRLHGNCYRGALRATMASAMLRRSAVVAAGGYPTADYMEDVEVLERVRLVCRRPVGIMRGADWYVLRRHGGNVTLDYRETDDEYTACALRDPATVEAQARLDALLRGPGREDVR